MTKGRAVAWNGQVWIAVGEGTPSAAVRSLNGQYWEAIDLSGVMSSPPVPPGVDYRQASFYAVHTNSVATLIGGNATTPPTGAEACIIKTIDPTAKDHWEGNLLDTVTFSTSPPPIITGITYGQYWVASFIGYGGTSSLIQEYPSIIVGGLYDTSGGWDWTFSFDAGTTTTVFAHDIAWNGFVHVAVGDISGGAGPIWVSPDGKTWTTPALDWGDQATLYTVAWTGQRWLAGGVFARNRCCF